MEPHTTGEGGWGEGREGFSWRTQSPFFSWFLSLLCTIVFRLLSGICKHNRFGLPQLCYLFVILSFRHLNHLKEDHLSWRSGCQSGVSVTTYHHCYYYYYANLIPLCEIRGYMFISGCSLSFHTVSCLDCMCVHCQIAILTLAVHCIGNGYCILDGGDTVVLLEQNDFAMYKNIQYFTYITSVLKSWVTNASVR